MHYLISFLFLFELSYAQINWSNVYGETHTDEGWFINKTDDGGGAPSTPKDDLKRKSLKLPPS